jgi:hypothetical protein
MLSLFSLIRTEDDLGRTSGEGVGVIAQGVIFPDGQVCLQGKWSPHEMSLYDSLDDVRATHGHDRAIVFILYHTEA